MTLLRRRQRLCGLALSATFTVLAASGCTLGSKASPPDPSASAAKLRPGLTACKVFPTDLAIKATSTFPGGLTQSGQPGTRPGSGFHCSIEVLRGGMRWSSIRVNLQIADAEGSFSAVRASLLGAPHLTLPSVLGEGYAKDNHAALLRRCPRSTGKGDTDYMIDLGIDKDIGFIPRADLAKVVVDAVPVIDKHLGCVPTGNT